MSAGILDANCRTRIFVPVFAAVRQDSRFMTFSLYAEFALAHDIPKCRVCRGDLVQLVEHHFPPAAEEG
jgi:hypothetical protein